MDSLSDEILVRIFRLLSARDLCRCSQVCSAWCRLTNDFHLWKRLFKKTFDKFITDPFYYNSVFPTQWKELFILRSNWFSGHCHVQSLHRRTVTTPHLNEVPVTKVSCLKISNCGRSLLASVNQDSRQVHLWSLIHKCSLHVVNCEGVVGCVDFGSERSRNLLAVGLHSNKFSLWDFQREKFLHSQSNLLGTSRGIVPQDASSPPELAVCRVNLVDNKLATVTVQCVVKIWQLEFHQHGSVSCHCLHTLTTFKPRCSVLDIQLKREPDDIWTVSISHAAEILEKWNLIGFQVVRFHGQTLINISQRVQVEDEVQEEDEEDVGIVYLESKAWTQRHTEQMGSRNTVSCLSISPCTKLITSGQDDNTISLWDTSTLCLRYTLFGHTGAITCTDVDMHKVVSGSNDRTVKVWSLESGDCQLTLPGDHSSGVSCVTFNDQWVISGDNSGEIKVWDFAVNSLSVLQSQDLIEAEDQGI